MVNGKIILGTLSIIASLVIFFDGFGDIISGENYWPIVPLLIAGLAATLGITLVRSGLTGKRKAS